MSAPDITVAQFRARFPEFTDTTKYPDPAIEVLLEESILMVDYDRWGRFYTSGVLHLTAHELKIGATAAQTSGGTSAAVGPISSKTVDKVSYSRAVNAVDVGSNEGYYSTTKYGLKYLQLLGLVRVPGAMVAR